MSKIWIKLYFIYIFVKCVYNKCLWILVVIRFPYELNLNICFLLFIEIPQWKYALCLSGLSLCNYQCAMCSLCIRAIMYIDIMQNKHLSIYLFNLNRRQIYLKFYSPCWNKIIVGGGDGGGSSEVCVAATLTLKIIFISNAMIICLDSLFFY